MADVVIVYGSMGFEKVSGELLELMKTSQDLSTGFRPLSDQAVESANDIDSAWSKLTDVFTQVQSNLGDLTKVFLQVGGAITGILAAIAVAAAGVFTVFTRSVVTATDDLRKLEIGLFGITKSWEGVNRVVQFAQGYADQYAVTSDQLLHVLTQLGRLPVVKPMIVAGDVAKMKELSDIVLGLSALRPEAGVEAAGSAFRMALMGRTRGLEMGYGIPIAALAAAAGPTTTPRELRKNAEEMMNALKVYIQQNVGAESMRVMSETVTSQISKLHEKYEEWLRSIGKTGPYAAVVGALKDLNEWLSSVIKSEKFAEFTRSLGEFIDSVISGVKRILTVDVDWDKVTDIEGALVAFRQIVTNATAALTEGWAIIKDPVIAILSDVFGAIAKAAVVIIYDLFLPVGGAIANAIIDGLKKAGKEHPIITMLIGGAAGAAMGTAVGGPGIGTAVGAVAGAEAVMLPTQIETIKGYYKGLKDWGAALLGLGKDLEATAPKAIVDGVKSAQDQIDKALSGFRKWFAPKELPTYEAPPGAGIPGAVRQPYAVGLEQQFGMYGAWSRMAGAMAKLPEKELETPTTRWVTGQINYDQYKELQRIGDFQDKQMGKLGEIRDAAEKVEGISPDKFGTLAKVYSEMFNIAVQKGDFSKAQDLMNKSLDAMRDQLKASSDLGKEELEAAKNTSLNSTKMEDHLKIIRDNIGKIVSISPKEGEKTPAVYRGYDVGKGTLKFSDTPYYDPVVQDVAQSQVE